jgi:hypothetical protein
MKVHVICCNDAIMHAVVEPDAHLASMTEARAGEKLEELANADFERNVHLWRDSHRQFGHLN